MSDNKSYWRRANWAVCKLWLSLLSHKNKKRLHLSSCWQSMLYTFATVCYSQLSMNKNKENKKICSIQNVVFLDKVCHRGWALYQQLLPVWITSYGTVIAWYWPLKINPNWKERDKRVRSLGLSGHKPCLLSALKIHFQVALRCIQ